MIMQMIADLQNRPDLLVAIQLTPHLKHGISCLISMLDSLPPNSPILQFIMSHPDALLSVKAHIVNGKLELLQQPKCFKVINLRGITTDGGVYLWSAVQDCLQYVGSTINQKMRVGGHISSIVHETDLSKLQLMHKWAKAHGGVTSVQWGVIYQTFNYYQAYLQSFPLELLSYKEVIVLKAMTELLPRILELSIILGFSLAWNQQNYVNFQFINKPNPPAYWNTNPVYIYDYYTGLPLRPPFPTRDLAINTLGLSEWKYGVRLNNSNGFDSKVLGQKSGIAPERQTVYSNKWKSCLLCSKTLIT